MKRFLLSATAALLLAAPAAQAATAKHTTNAAKHHAMARRTAPRGEGAGAVDALNAQSLANARSGTSAAPAGSTAQ